MKAISRFFVAFIMLLFLGISANAQQQLVVYGLGSLDIRYIPCQCEACFVEPCLPCECSDVVKTNTLNPNPGQSALYMIDYKTGVPYFIGETGFTACRGLDSHPGNGDLYAVCKRSLLHGGPPGPPGQLITDERVEELGQFLVHIDEETGLGTEIGPLGDGIGYLEGRFISDISFYKDGTLYAHLHAFDLKKAQEGISTSNGATANMLGTIDLATGKFNLIGPTNSDDVLSAIGFSPDDTLYQCANFSDKFKNKANVDSRFINYFTNINSLNIGTGNATFLSPVLFPPDVQGHLNVIQSKDFDDATGDAYGFLSTEEIRKSAEAGEGVDSRNLIPDGSYLVRIDQATGGVQLIGQTSPPFEDFLAISVRRFVRNVPTMSEYGLMATAVFILGASVLYLRRRKARTEV